MPEGVGVAFVGVSAEELIAGAAWRSTVVPGGTGETAASGCDAGRTRIAVESSDPAGATASRDCRVDPGDALVVDEPSGSS